MLLITLFSLLALFEKPAVNQEDRKQNRKVAVETGQRFKDDKETTTMIYFQEDMNFFINAYGVGNP